MTKPTDFMTVQEIAEFADMPQSTAYILSGSRHFPAPRLVKGRFSLWDRKDVVRFFEQHKRPEMQAKKRA
jgi:predicted DNA-binding transcriptional regulator AlpA